MANLPLNQMENLKPHEDWKDPLEGGPTVEEQMNMMMPMVMGTMEKRDKGEALGKMERTLMAMVDSAIAYTARQQRVRPRAPISPLKTLMSEAPS